MMEIPEEVKPSAAYGCWLAAALYVATFMLSYGYKLNKSRGARAREPAMSEMTRMHRE